jgi:AbrB family looped-hinge helix DNA binding protein
MRTNIDRAGRIVVPRAIRDELGLVPGQPLELRAADGGITIEVVPTELVLVDGGRGLVAEPAAGMEMPVLTADAVRTTLDAVRSRPLT